MKLAELETDREVVSESEWLVARRDLLTREKEFTRQRDALSAARRALPMVKIDKDYIFDGPDGEETLSDLFDGRRQLIVYHFMFGPDWDEGCKSCSYLADHFDGVNWHLRQRDVTFVAISRAPYAEIAAYQKRMGWKFKWLSSHGSDFNFDYQVSFTKENQQSGKVYYNYTTRDFVCEEFPGLSVFYKDESGDVFHTYSTYARGLDILIGAYNFLDLVPKGRDENPDSTMDWVRRHDEYPAQASRHGVDTTTRASKAERPPIAKAEMLIRKPVGEVFEAFVDPAITSKFWFSKGSNRLEAGQQVTWEWEMYGFSVPVNVKTVERNARIIVEWSAGDTLTPIEWNFRPCAGGTTFVSVTNWGFPGNDGEAWQQAAGASEGFAFVLAGAKAFLEHNIRLNLVPDRHPDGIGAECKESAA